MSDSVTLSNLQDKQLIFCAALDMYEALKIASGALELAYKVPRPWISGGTSWEEWDSCCQTIDDASSAIRIALAKAEGRSL